MLLLFLEAFHKAKILAMDAAAKIMVAKNKENDHVVKLPKREMKTSAENIHMTTIHNRLNTAISGHNNMLNSSGRRCFLLRYRNIQRGA